jgi:hypothetical protein
VESYFWGDFMNEDNGNPVAKNEVIYRGKEYNVFFTYANGDCELIEKDRFHLLLVPRTNIKYLDREKEKEINNQ